VARVKLREMMKLYEKKTGRRLTYGAISAVTGISPETLQSIATRRDYNPTLSTIETLCRTLECSIDQLVEVGVGNGHTQAQARRKRRTRAAH
jgi:DNA-binding Xre family transcriptional regulator